MRNRTDIIENDERNIFCPESDSNVPLYQLNLPFVTPAKRNFANCPSEQLGILHYDIYKLHTVQAL